MIWVRRTFAVFSVTVLIGALAAALVVHRANQTVLKPDFYEAQLAAVGVYDAIHNEVLPTALSDFLAEQQAKLPENLSDVSLPTDAASQQRMLDLARTAAPPDYLESVANEVIQSMVAYVTGKTSDFALNLSFNQPIEAAFAPTSTGPSPFENAWREIDLTHQAFQGLAMTIHVPELDTFQSQLAIQMLAVFRAQGFDLETSSALAFQLYESAPTDAAIPELTNRILAGDASDADIELLQGFLAVEGVPADQAVSITNTLATEGVPSEVTPLSLLLGSDEEAAVAWFEGELFTAVRELTAYLSGAQPEFSIHIDFSPYPQIAEVAAGVLNKTPDELLRDGYSLNSADINAELAKAKDPPIDSLEEARAWFTAAGRTLSMSDLQNIGNGQSTSGSGNNTLETIRSVLTPVSSYGLPLAALAVALVTLEIAFAGGRHWWSRATWGASALAAAAVGIFAVTGPLYKAVVAPELTRALDDSRTQLLASDNPATALGLRALDQMQLVINQQVGAIATNALIVGGVALFVAGIAVASHVYLERRATASETTPEPVPFGTTAVEPEPSEERAAA